MKGQIEMEHQLATQVAHLLTYVANTNSGIEPIELLTVSKLVEKGGHYLTLTQ